MFKIIFLTILVFFTNDINANSYQKFKPHIREKIGYKPYTKILDKKEIKCLADNIYYEAGNQTENGKVAVALVTLNRSNSWRFPKTICQVVYQRSRWKCQFSWVCNRNRQIKYWKQYEESQEIANKVLLNYDNMEDITFGATFFHRNDIRPPWLNPRIKKTVAIGRHIFYKI